MVRPGNVLVGKVGDVRSGHSYVNGVLRSVIYAGEHRKVFIQRQDGTELIARLHASGSFPFEVGDPVVAYWSPTDGIIVEGDVEPTGAAATAMAR